MSVGSNAANLEPLAVSVKEATRMLGYKDPDCIRDLIHAGKLKATKPGRIYLVSYRSLREFMGE